MGKPAFPPQGAGTPVLSLGAPWKFPLPPTVALNRLASLVRRAKTPAATRSSLLSKKQISRNEEDEHYGDHSIHSEKGGVETGEIVGLDQGMFIEQEQHYYDYAG
jgi:hypothetical protein